MNETPLGGGDPLGPQVTEAKLEESIRALLEIAVVPLQRRVEALETQLQTVLPALGVLLSRVEALEWHLGIAPSTADTVDQPAEDTETDHERTEAAWQEFEEKRA